MAGSGDFSAASVVTVHIDGTAFADPDRFHSELACQLGLPGWYGRNLDALLDCLSSIGADGGLCARWQWRPEACLLLQVHDVSWDRIRSPLMHAFVQVVADANARLAAGGATNRIWVEFKATMHDVGGSPNG